MESIKGWRRQLARRRRLRALQRMYYAGPDGSAPVISEYLRVLAEAREEELRRSGHDTRRVMALHVGSGGHYLQRWINIDLNAGSDVDVAADLASSIPFRSSSVDYIHSEDFLEHIDVRAGRRFLGEAYRVLRPGGVMRLLTPDLRALIEEVYNRRDSAQLAWCRAYLDAEGPCESLNMHLRMNGEHRFIYDAEHFRRITEEIGFAVRRVRYNASRDPFLRYLDLRDFGLNLFFECRKPNS